MIDYGKKRGKRRFLSFVPATSTGLQFITNGRHYVIYNRMRYVSNYHVQNKVLK